MEPKILIITIFKKNFGKTWAST